MALLFGSGANNFNGYFPERVPKPSDYIHYFAYNVSDQVKQDIFALYHMDKRAVLAQQYSTFKKAQSKVSSVTKNAGANAEVLAQLFDVGVYQQQLDQYLSTSGGILEGTEDLSMIDFESALQRIKTLNLENDSKSLKEFVFQVEKIINNYMGKPSSAEIEAIGKSLLLKYARNVGIIGTSASELTARQTSLVSTKILRDFLSRTNDKLFKLDGEEEAEIFCSNTIKRLATMIAALKTFSSSGIEMKQATVKSHHSKNQKRASGAEQILGTLQEKTSNTLIWMRRIAAETTKVYGSLKAQASLFNALNNANLFKSKKMGNRYFNYSIDVQNNPTMKRMIEESGQSIARMETKASKSDNGIYINGNSVEANLGFTVKTSENNVPVAGKSINRVSIKLQDSTPLSTLLFRELGFNSNELFALVQLLAQHDDDLHHIVPDSNVAWESVKQNITEAAFLSALSGIGAEERSYFLVYDNKIISIESILRARLTNGSIKLGSNLRLADSNISGSLNRADYLQNNRWIDVSTKKSDTQAAYIRSDTTFGSISRMLYNTKIRVDMTISSTQDLLKLI